MQEDFDELNQNDRKGSF